MSWTNETEFQLGVMVYALDDPIDSRGFVVGHDVDEHGEPADSFPLRVSWEDPPDPDEYSYAALDAVAVYCRIHGTNCPLPPLAPYPLPHYADGYGPNAGPDSRDVELDDVDDDTFTGPAAALWQLAEDSELAADGTIKLTAVLDKRYRALTRVVTLSRELAEALEELTPLDSE